MKVFAFHGHLFHPTHFRMLTPTQMQQIYGEPFETLPNSWHPSDHLSPVPGKKHNLPRRGWVGCNPREPSTIETIKDLHGFIDIFWYSFEISWMCTLLIQLYLRILFGGNVRQLRGNPVLCQPVFDSRQRRVDLMRGSVCFYLPCKDARALCQSVVGFTPATCCQKKKTTRVVNAFGSWNIFDVILFFLFFFEGVDFMSI